MVGLLYLTLNSMLPQILGVSVFVGGLCGYVVYDMIHYYLHYGSPKRGTYLYGLKAYHVKHHFEHQRSGQSVRLKPLSFRKLSEPTSPQRQTPA